MKAFTGSSQRVTSSLLIVLTAILGFFLLLVFPSCQKYDQDLLNEESLKGLDIVPGSELIENCYPIKNSKIYYGPKKFIRSAGAPHVETQIIQNPNFNCYDGNFVLKIKNGISKMTRVSSAEIRIDGILVAGPSDFSKNVSLITKPLSELKPESILEVKLKSAPGSFITLWIEGTKTGITPTFVQIGPLCQNSIAPALPLSSTNTPAITGTWNPTSISTAMVGKTTYTFTPSEGECGTAATMEIEITPLVTPTFTQIGPLSQNSVAPTLPTTSNNGITGTWSPETINTTIPGTYSFAFTPAAGQCATAATMIIEVKNKGLVYDIDGNQYKTILIGNQWWITENLKTTKYNNGDLIGTTNPATLDISLETNPKYQWVYNNDESNVSIYGRLYTWYAVTDSRGVCPAEWHLPSVAEWTTLINYLIDKGYGYEGSGTDIGKSLANTSGWTAYPTPGAVGNDQATNNSTGFTAVPGGYRVSGGAFRNTSNIGVWWTSTENSNVDASMLALYHTSSIIVRSYSDYKSGVSIRCVKDN